MREKQLAQEAKKLDAKVGGAKSWSGGQDIELRMQGARKDMENQDTHTLTYSLPPFLPLGAADRERPEGGAGTDGHRVTLSRVIFSLYLGTGTSCLLG